MKANNSRNYESVMVIINKDEYPIIFESIVKEQMSLGLSRETAEKYADGLEIELELYYQPNYGLFGVDAEAVDAHADLHSPYDKEAIEYEDED